MIDESTLAHPELFEVLKALPFQSKNVTIYLDETLKGLTTKEHVTEEELSMIHYWFLFDRHFKTEHISPETFENIDILKTWLDEKKDDTVIITQNKSKAFALKSVEQEASLRITYHQKGTLVDWQLDTSKRPAFYIENDDYLQDSRKNEIPENLDYVYSPRFGHLKLGPERAFYGGEGDVYRTYNRLLFKRLKPKYLTYQNYKKISRMLEIAITNDQIVWPKDIVYHDDMFLGYLMNEITDAMSMDDLRDIGFGPFSPIDRIKIAIRFMKNVDYLHQRRILIGDMKFDNILVKSPEEVYIIDAGSFQVDDYPCLVFNYEFSDKEFTENDLKQTLRSVDDEYYPINKILFEILVLKSPYYSASQIEIGGEETREFTYPLTVDQLSGNMPSHLKLWMSLPEEIRLNFFQYFVNRRITYLQDLIPAFEKFLNNIHPEGEKTHE
jgi:hypothetical protein